MVFLFFFSSRRRHTRWPRDWSSDVCSSDLSIDFAVHSLKDIPVELPPGLMIASIPEREDFRDALLANHHMKLHDLPQGAVVGTSSLRRAAQVLSQRPDLEIKWIRDRKSTRLNSSHVAISYAVFCLKKKKETLTDIG